MDISLIILLLFIVIASIVAFINGGLPLFIKSLNNGGKTILSMWWRVILGILLGGFIQVLLPRSLVAEWIGPSSGLQGILIGSFTGMILSGGAFAVIPVIASIYAAGAAEGPIIALLVSASLTRIQGLIILEIPFFGMRIAMTRYILCLFIPPIIGFSGSLIYRFLL